MLTDHLHVTHNSDEERCSLHCASECDPLQRDEVFVRTSRSAIPEVQYVRSGWCPNTLQPQGEFGLGPRAVSSDRSVLIVVFGLRSLPMQGSPVNCWTRSTRISPKWSPGPTPMATLHLIFTLIFVLFPSFFLVSAGATANEPCIYRRSGCRRE